VRVRNEGGDQVTIDVQDNGPGIPIDDHAKVFDRFYRVDKARSRESGGAGLGLAIAKWAIEAHGGSIAVQSAPDQGCTFRISLPAALNEPSSAAPSEQRLTGVNRQ
jgi:signal transduction histidine kinase